MLTLRDIMTREVLTFTPDTSMRRAMDALTARHLSGAPVMAGHTVLGVVSISDLLGFAAAQPNPGARQALGADEDSPTWEELPAWDLDTREELPVAFYAKALKDGDVDTAMQEAANDGPASPLDEHTVDEIMTRELCAMPPTAAVRDAARFMSRAGVHRILVLDGGTLVGLVSTMDIAKAVASSSVLLHRAPRKMSTD